MTNSCKHTFRPDCESLEGLVLLSPLPSGPGGLGVIAPPGVVFIVEPCAELGASYAQIPKFGVQDPGGGNHVVREVAVLTAPPSSDSPLRPLGLTTDDTITRLNGVPLSCDQVDAHVGPATITYIRSSQGEFFEQTGTINLGAAANQKVLDFVRSRLGTQVGDGQCATLAYQALAYAGAKNFGVLGPTGPDADYVWGTPVATLTPASHSTASIMPGDIIQFRDVLIRTDYPNGSWTEMRPAHHTAIVTDVSGNTLTIAEQNVNGVMQVQLKTQNVDGLREGTMWVYRPIAT